MYISKIRSKNRGRRPEISSTKRKNQEVAVVAVTGMVRNQATAEDGRAKASGVGRIKKVGGLYGLGVRRQAGIVIAPGHQHSFRYASLHLTLQRVMIASEAAGGIFTGQLLTNARLDVLTLS